MPRGASPIAQAERIATTLRPLCLGWMLRMGCRRWRDPKKSQRTQDAWQNSTTQGKRLSLDISQAKNFPQSPRSDGLHEARSPRNLWGDALNPVRMPAVFRALMWRTNISANTARKSVVKARSRPSKSLPGLSPCHSPYTLPPFTGPPKARITLACPWSVPWFPFSRAVLFMSGSDVEVYLASTAWSSPQEGACAESRRGGWNLAQLEAAQIIQSQRGRSAL